MSHETFLIYFVTTFLIILSPGASVALVMGQSAGNGAVRSFAGIFGIAIANVTFFVLSACGLTALLASSPGLFSVIKWIGVAYLLWLALLALRSSSGFGPSGRSAASSPGVLFRQGYFVEITNPKAFLYMGAALPQFLDLERPQLPQFAIMGSVGFVLDCLIYGAYAFLGAAVAKGMFGQHGLRVLNLLIGSALIYVAVSLSFFERSGV